MKYLIIFFAVISALFIDTSAFCMEGDTGDEVLALQSALYKEGLYYGAEDGSFNTELTEAVKAYQSKHLLYPDGICSSPVLRRLGIAESVPLYKEQDTMLLARFIHKHCKGKKFITMQRVASVVACRAETCGYNGSVASVIYSLGGVKECEPTQKEMRAALEVLLGARPCGQIFEFERCRLGERPYSTRQSVCVYDGFAFYN